MKLSVAFAVIAISLCSVSARPAASDAKPFTRQNGLDAIALNQKFQSLTPNSPCQSGENACVNQKFAQCVNGKFVLTNCAGGTICAALPLVNKAGTSITCTTAADRDARIAATGANKGGKRSPANNGGAGNKHQGGNNGGNNNGGNNGDNNGGNNNGGNNGDNNGGNNGGNDDPQKSLCLLDNLVQTSFEQDGQETPAAGQVASLTSSNNFINFCATTNLPLTNGAQVKGGSCNAAPMGIIASVNNMPSSKFVFPVNLDTIQANQPFTIKMAVSHLTTGNFVNAQANYFSAPQQIDDNGDIKGHSHVVIEKLDSLKQTSPTSPASFAFFKGMNNAAVDGILTADVTDGLPEGSYRLASINTAANHQPALVAVAQHGSLDDAIYFTVTNSGQPDGNNNNGNDNGNGGDNGNNNGDNNGNNGNNGGDNNGDNNGGDNNGDNNGGNDNGDKQQGGKNGGNNNNGKNNGKNNGDGKHHRNH